MCLFTRTYAFGMLEECLEHYALWRAAFFFADLNCLYTSILDRCFICVPFSFPFVLHFACVNRLVIFLCVHAQALAVNELSNGLSRQSRYLLGFVMCVPLADPVL